MKPIFDTVGQSATDKFDIDADVLQALLHDGRRVGVGAKIVDDEGELLALVAGFREQGLGGIEIGLVVLLGSRLGVEGAPG